MCILINHQVSWMSNVALNLKGFFKLAFQAVIFFRTSVREATLSTYVDYIYMDKPAEVARARIPPACGFPLRPPSMVRLC